MDKKALTKANEQLDIITQANKNIKAIKTMFNNKEAFIENNNTLYSYYNKIKIPTALKKDIENILLNYYKQKIKAAESIIENL